jgi:hypothetical protein
MSTRALVISMLMLLSVACYGPDREPGDDPTRADEGPTAGRPKTDPYDTVDRSGPSGGRTTDADTNETTPPPDSEANGEPGR